MATNNAYGGPLTGLAADLAGLPLAATPQGGVEFGFRGVSGSTPPQQPADEGVQFAGQGPLLEADAHTAWKTCEDLRLRQILLWKNHLAQDTHWTRVKLGYPWSTLVKDDNKDIYRCTLPPGVSELSSQAVPNITWDQVRKATAALLANFPKPRVQALTTSDRAERAASMATQFLAQDGAPDGMDDETLFYTSLERALTCSTTYHRYWVDQTGAGYVPLQIKAHPQAVDPQNPFTLPDGSVASPADAVERYVTAPTPTAPAGAFTTDPSQAAPMWLPRIRVDRLGREHVCVFPESEPVKDADQVLVTYYCTVGEAKRRWPETVGTLGDDEISQLCDWTPPQYLPLLPAQLRARWRISTGDNSERSGSNDQRVLFFYSLYQRDVPEYPHGAELHVSGAFGGYLLGKDTLALPVKIPGDGGQDVQEIRCRDVPVLQLTPMADPDERDPSGRAYVSLFGGAAEYTATLATNLLEKMDLVLHSEGYIPSTSPVEGSQRDDARSTGDLIPVLSKDDVPFYPEQPPMPPGLLDAINWGIEQIQGIASLPKPLTGSDNQQEVSGRARLIAVQQGQIGLGPMSAAVNAAYVRHCRIKLQLAQASFPVPLQIRYVGEDGAYKQEAFEASDFALVGETSILPGTGTLMAPDQMVNYAAQAVQAGLMDPDTAKELARGVFGDVLGVESDPAGERAERCLSAWLKGPPVAWVQAVQAWQQQTQQTQQQYQMQAQAAQQSGQQPPPPPQMPPEPPLPPEANPFDPRANDAEPAVAAVWVRILSRGMQTVRYAEQPPAWRQIYDQTYQRFAQALAMQAAGVSTPQDLQNFQNFQKATSQLSEKLMEKQMASIIAEAQAPAPQPQAPPGMAAGAPQ